jgi:hypothetical protein
MRVLLLWGVLSQHLVNDLFLRWFWFIIIPVIRMYGKSGGSASPGFQYNRMCHLLLDVRMKNPASIKNTITVIVLRSKKLAGFPRPANNTFSNLF